MIDYTLLDNNASDQDITDLCEKASRFGTKSVCVMPKHVKLSSDLLKESEVLVCTVVDFPGGNKDSNFKVNETKQVINDGADEVDMVLNYNSLIENDNIEELTDEVNALSIICHGKLNKNNEDVVLKVIVESGLLTEEQTEKATEICLAAEADFIKTSTGKVSVGAELDKVRIMKSIIDENHSKMEIKVSGGVRTLEQIKKYGQLGATRFGMGYGSVDTLNGLESKNSGY
tara:strand:- start:65854 stop:66543 length:690 start_codon:yes stop_codon:yes gene_type:complete